jgi:hypothetical protein
MTRTQQHFPISPFPGCRAWAGLDLPAQNASVFLLQRQLLQDDSYSTAFPYFALSRVSSIGWFRSAGSDFDRRDRPLLKRWPATSLFRSMNSVVGVTTNGVQTSLVDDQNSFIDFYRSSTLSVLFFDSRDVGRFPCWSDGGRSLCSWVRTGWILENHGWLCHTVRLIFKSDQTRRVSSRGSSASVQTSRACGQFLTGIHREANSILDWHQAYIFLPFIRGQTGDEIVKLSSSINHRFLLDLSSKPEGSLSSSLFIDHPAFPLRLILDARGSVILVNQPQFPSWTCSFCFNTRISIYFLRPVNCGLTPIVFTFTHFSPISLIVDVQQHRPRILTV